MSKEKKYYISKSGHTLKRKNPIVTKDGTIYETDLSTTLKSHEYVDGKLITRTEGGFVFVTNIESDTPRSFNKTTETKRFELSELIGVDKEINEEMVLSEAESLKNIKLSPSYDKLSDYCYYGSANAMLKAEIEDIIDKYPFIPTEGELTEITIKELKVITEGLNIYIPSKFNKSEIIEAILNWKMQEKEVFFNNLSDFQKILLNKNTTPRYKATFKVPIETDKGIKHVYKSFIHPSHENGDLDVKSTNYNIYLSSLIDITNLIDEIYCDNLYRVMTHDSIKNFDFSYSKDDIEEYIIGGSKVNKVLRIYGRSFDDVKKYIDGISTVNTITYNGKNNMPKEYFYDVLNLKGWVPYNIAEHFDGLWEIRATVVETGDIVEITQSDWGKPEKLETGGVDMEGDVSDRVIRLYQRSKTTPKTPTGGHTYNFKTGVLSIKDEESNLHGWELMIPTKGVKTSKGIQPSLSDGIGVEEVTHELLRRFIINSPNIFRAKGTKKAISKVFSLFGIKDEWYDIFEIYQPVDDYIESDKLEEIAEQNYNVNNMEQSISDIDPHTFDVERDMFKGINIKAKYVDGNIVGIPYHSESTYENYFQQKGGWYRETGGFHEHIDGESQVMDIPYGNNPHIGNGKYDNGYDYVMSYKNLFKRYESPGGESEDDVLGFGITQKRQLVSDKIFTDSDNTDLNINLKNMLIVFNDKEIKKSYTDIDPDLDPEQEHIVDPEDFELIKKLTLPYIEQIIPSTTIFDMILKSTDPIWSYLDSYCEMDENGNATGMKIVRYQDVNPYSKHGDVSRDEKNASELNELKTIVDKKFGGDFKHEGVKIIGDETLTGDEYTNYDNIFIFKGESSDCPINVNPNWKIIDDLI